ncbi:MAG: hypothetical protein WBD22_03820 [Pyrinomonadaceae bacterium]
MLSQKNHNSIFFLTTLGVYLGLVLVGVAAPKSRLNTVFAQNFDVTYDVGAGDQKEPRLMVDRLAMSVVDTDFGISECLSSYLALYKRIAPVSEFTGSRQNVFLCDISLTPAYDGPRDQSLLAHNNQTFTVARLPRASLRAQSL